MKLGQILLQRHIITKEQLAISLWVQERWGGSLGRILLSRGYLKEKDLIEALSFQMGISVVFLKNKTIPKAVKWMLDQGICERYLIFPFETEPETGVLKLAMVDPQDEETLYNIEKLSHCEVRPYLAGFIDLTEAIWRNYNLYTAQSTYYQDLVEELSSKEPVELGELEILRPDDSEYIDIRDSGPLPPEIIEIVESEEFNSQGIEDSLEILEEQEILEDRPFSGVGEVTHLDPNLLTEILSDGEEDEALSRNNESPSQDIEKHDDKE